MRNWLTAFRPASFRGAPFFVEFEEGEGGRRLAVSPIAYSDVHVDEDMGGKPRTVRLTAYTLGDYADTAAIALANALQASGPGTLVAPMLPGGAARVTAWRLAREKLRAGYVAFDIDFVLGGVTLAPFARVAIAPRLAGLMLAGAAVVAAAAAFRLRAVSAGRGAVHADAAGFAAQTLQAFAAGTGIAPERAADLADAGKTIERLAEDPSGNAAEIATAIVETAAALGDEADAGEMAAACAQSPFDLPVTGGHWLAPTASAADRLMFAATPFGLALDAALAGAWCQALARGDYASRQDARRARERIAPRIDPVLGALGDGLGRESHDWLDGVASATAQDLSETAADRAPLVRVETGVSLSATALAYALYGDAERAGELAIRNRVATPAMMPVRFEALER